MCLACLVIKSVSFRCSVLGQSRAQAGAISAHLRARHRLRQSLLTKASFLSPTPAVDSDDCTMTADVGDEARFAMLTAQPDGRFQSYRTNLLQARYLV